MSRNTAGAVSHNLEFPGAPFDRREASESGTAMDALDAYRALIDTCIGRVPKSTRDAADYLCFHNDNIFPAKDQAPAHKAVTINDTTCFQRDMINAMPYFLVLQKNDGESEDAYMTRRNGVVAKWSADIAAEEGKVGECTKMAADMYIPWLEKRGKDFDKAMTRELIPHPANCPFPLKMTDGRSVPTEKEYSLGVTVEVGKGIKHYDYEKKIKLAADYTGESKTRLEAHFDRAAVPVLERQINEFARDGVISWQSAQKWLDRKGLTEHEWVENAGDAVILVERLKRCMLQQHWLHQQGEKDGAAFPIHLPGGVKVDTDAKGEPRLSGLETVLPPDLRSYRAVNKDRTEQLERYLSTEVPRVQELMKLQDKLVKWFDEPVPGHIGVFNQDGTFATALNPKQIDLLKSQGVPLNSEDALAPTTDEHFAALKAMGIKDANQCTYQKINLLEHRANVEEKDGNVVVHQTTQAQYVPWWSYQNMVYANVGKAKEYDVVVKPDAPAFIEDESGVHMKLGEKLSGHVKWQQTKHYGEKALVTALDVSTAVSGGIGTTALLRNGLKQGVNLTRKEFAIQLTKELAKTGAAGAGIFQNANEFGAPIRTARTAYYAVEGVCSFLPNRFSLPGTTKMNGAFDQLSPWLKTTHNIADKSATAALTVNNVVLAKDVGQKLIAKIAPDKDPDYLARAVKALGDGIAVMPAGADTFDPKNPLFKQTIAADCAFLKSCGDVLKSRADKNDQTEIDKMFGEVGKFLHPQEEEKEKYNDQAKAKFKSELMQQVPDLENVKNLDAKQLAALISILYLSREKDGTISDTRAGDRVLSGRAIVDAIRGQLDSSEHGQKQLVLADVLVRFGGLSGRELATELQDALESKSNSRADKLYALSSQHTPRFLTLVNQLGGEGDPQAEKLIQTLDAAATDPTGDADVRAMSAAALHCLAEKDPDRRYELWQQCMAKNQELIDKPGTFSQWFQQHLKAEAEKAIPVLTRDASEDEIRSSDEAKARKLNAAVSLAMLLDSDAKKDPDGQKHISRAMADCFSATDLRLASEVVTLLLEDNRIKDLDAESATRIREGSVGVLQRGMSKFAKDTDPRVIDLAENQFALLLQSMPGVLAGDKVAGADTRKANLNSTAINLLTPTLTPGSGTFADNYPLVRIAAIHCLSQLHSGDDNSLNAIRGRITAEPSITVGGAPRINGDGSVNLNKQETLRAGETDGDVRIAAVQALLKLADPQLSQDFLFNLKKTERDKTVRDCIDDAEKMSERTVQGSREWVKDYDKFIKALEGVPEPGHGDVAAAIRNGAIGSCKIDLLPFVNYAREHEEIEKKGYSDSVAMEKFQNLMHRRQLQWTALCNLAKEDSDDGRLAKRLLYEAVISQGNPFARQTGAPAKGSWDGNDDSSHVHMAAQALAACCGPDGKGRAEAAWYAFHALTSPSLTDGGAKCDLLKGIFDLDKEGKDQDRDKRPLDHIFDRHFKGKAQLPAAGPRYLSAVTFEALKADMTARTFRDQSPQLQMAVIDKVGELKDYSLGPILEAIKDMAKDEGVKAKAAEVYSNLFESVDRIWQDAPALDMSPATRARRVSMAQSTMDNAVEIARAIAQAYKNHKLEPTDTEGCNALIRALQHPDSRVQMAGARALIESNLPPDDPAFKYAQISLSRIGITSDNDRYRQESNAFLLKSLRGQNEVTVDVPVKSGDFTVRLKVSSVTKDGHTGALAQYYEIPAKHDQSQYEDCKVGVSYPFDGRRFLCTRDQQRNIVEFIAPDGDKYERNGNWPTWQVTKRNGERRFEKCKSDQPVLWSSGGMMLKDLANTSIWKKDSDKWEVHPSQDDEALKKCIERSSDGKDLAADITSIFAGKDRSLRDKQCPPFTDKTLAILRDLMKRQNDSVRIAAADVVSRTHSPIDKDDAKMAVTILLDVASNDRASLSDRQNAQRSLIKAFDDLPPGKKLTFTIADGKRAGHACIVERDKVGPDQKDRLVIRLEKDWERESIRFVDDRMCDLVYSIVRNPDTNRQMLVMKSFALQKDNELKRYNRLPNENYTRFTHNWQQEGQPKDKIWKLVGDPYVDKNGEVGFFEAGKIHWLSADLSKMPEKIDHSSPPAGQTAQPPYPNGGW